MKHILLFGSLLLIASTSMAQDFINFYHSGSTDTYQLYDEDSIYFDAAHTNLYFSNNATVYSLLVSDIDSITVINDNSKNVYIDYNGNAVTVTNPLASSGVLVSVSGAIVEVTSTSTYKDINYILSGTSTDGTFKVYSEKRYNLLLNGLTLANSTGPAINLQSEKKATVHLVTGTTSNISDGSTYATAPNGEDQKAAFFSEGNIDVVGGGSLIINGSGSSQHAFASDEDIEIIQGTITVISSTKDGIHGAEGFTMNGGTVVISGTGGDGIDAESGAVEINCGQITITNTVADTKAIKCDSTMTITGGTVQLTISGDQSKGLKSGQQLTIEEGSITANSSGNAVLTASGSGYDPSYSSLITSDAAIVINGGTISLTTTGKGGRGISGDADVTINGGQIAITSSGNGATYTNSTGTADSYHSVNLKVDGNLLVTAGTLTFQESGSAGKGIMVDGTATIGTSSTVPVISLTTTGSSLTVSSGSSGGSGGPGGPGGGGGSSSSATYDKSKTFKADGAITIENGTITINSADDGIKSITSVTFNGGTVLISNSYEGVEAPYITVNGGSVSVFATDDGFNATMGTTSGGTESNDGSILAINDGYVMISVTGGDGIDSNGNVQITGGTVVVHGPTSSPELGLDYNSTGTVSGGFVVISGPGTNMLQGFGTSSTQKSLILKTSPSVSANTIFHIEDASGTNLVSFKPTRAYQTIVFSSSSLTQGGTYKVYTSGSDSGTLTDGLYSGGTYTSGTLETTFTVSGTVTTVTF